MPASKPIPSADLPEILTASQLIQLLQISEKTFSKLIRTPDFPKFIRLGQRARRWNKNQVMEFLSSGGIAHSAIQE